MRVLVTGAGGFIGAHVVRDLLAGGHEVLALDRPAASLARIGSAVDRVRIARLDLDDATSIRDLLARERPDAILHLAWYADPRDYLVGPANVASLTATIGLVESALATGCRKLVLTGSCVEYALAERPLRESDPAEPRTLYSACKHAAWTVARALTNAAGAELAWARIFHLHGPGEDPRRLIQWVAAELRAGRPVDLTDGIQIRDHLHVADIAAGLTAMLAPGATGIYNVCSGEPVTLRAVLETVGDLVGRPELLHFGARPHRADETMYLAGDSSRLRGLGWAPRFGLRDGLANAIGATIAG